MGTQQLLLIVLGILIVGIAVSIAVSIFGTNAEQANQDAMVQDCLRIVSAGQTYHCKPEMLGGGGNTFKGLAITDCAMVENRAGFGETLNGEYEIVKSSRKDLVIIGRSAANSEQTVTVSVHMYCDKHEDRIEVETAGWN